MKCCVQSKGLLNIFTVMINYLYKFFYIVLSKFFATIKKLFNHKIFYYNLSLEKQYYL